MSQSYHQDHAGAKLGMWLFLFTELILFGGLFLLYGVYLARYPHEFSEAGREMHVIFGTVNTGILITSSLLAAMAVTAIQREDKHKTEVFLAGTILCAGGFLLNKYFEWSAEIRHGIYPHSPTLAAGAQGKSIFFDLYFLTVGLHGLHVLIGGTLLALVAVRVHRHSIHAGNYVLLENSVLYWHLVDLIWIFIFPLYYLLL